MEQEAKLELWGGFECTVARVSRPFGTKPRKPAMPERPEDLDAAAALGIRTLRYPALWETISPDDPDACEWGWHDERFDRLRRLAIRPIVGPPAPWQRAALHEPRRSRVPRVVRPPRRARGPALPVDRPLHPGERASDHGQVQRPLWPLVPARGQHGAVSPGFGQSVQGDRSRHARDPASHARAHN